MKEDFGIVMNTETYKYACWYMAETELYDRHLTQNRNPGDPTEAFIISSPWQRAMSNRYALILREHLSDRWPDVKRVIKRYSYYSAQHWIDEYERIK